MNEEINTQDITEYCTLDIQTSGLFETESEIIEISIETVK